MYLKTILQPVVMEDKPGYPSTVSEQAYKLGGAIFFKIRALFLHDLNLHVSLGLSSHGSKQSSLGVNIEPNACSS